MKKNKFIVVSAIVTITLGFLSCTEEASQSLSAAEQVALEASVEEVESVIDAYSLYAVSSLEFESTGKTSSGKTQLGKGCKDRSGFFPDCTVFEEVIEDDVTTITISFPDDCEDRNGDIISGTITIVKSSLDTDKSRSITFDAFTVNGYVVNGTKTHEYTAENENGNPQIEGSVNITIETDEGTITKVGTRLVEVTAGGDTDTHKDDEKTITGSYSFTDVEDNTKSVEITTALVKPAACKYIAEGIKEYTEADETSILDYGDGTCDNVATLTEADETVTEIELKRKRRRF
ncbi:hypothetical protein Q4Q35_06095 [Flavivirga aquimarina]|uniref:Lipoprotein n=1 Tax=Flavivirga aquimarina TaxID=2027862 RepID=A0ABT8W8F5_9FLAO|nr:hypothetical protein [Flavivirga aquimarina]MDO5969371.1 hypothetical protein [Flavivirga aquimarina]